MKSRRQARWSVSAAIGAVICCCLLAGAVSPVWAGEPDPRGRGGWPAGGFAIGDGVEGLIDEASGALSFTTSVGGVGLQWESLSAGRDRFGFGGGWSVAGVGFVDVSGGIRVVPARGDVFDVDDTVSSGLRGYEFADLRFEQVSGVVPVRSDGLVGERWHAFRLLELGGAVSYFDAAGNPVARIDRFGARTDWQWADGASHRLQRVVSPVGVVTAFGWSEPDRITVSTRAGSGPASVWTIERDGGRLVGVVEPGGAHTRVTYSETGLVSRVSAASGAATEVSWRPSSDAGAAVERVRIVDQSTAAVMSERSWSPVTGSASGWPIVHDAAAVSARSAATPGFSTAVSDGVTRVESEYAGDGSLTTRRVVAGSAAGDLVVHEQVFAYPARGGGTAVRGAAPGQVVVTYSDEAGRTRVAEERFTSDAFGRVVEHASADGTVTVTAYDSEPGAHAMPVGLPVLERTVAPDGAISESRHELNAARTAVIATETWTGTDRAGTTRSGRVEFEVAHDGFVTAERMFLQGGEGHPVVTVRDRVIDHRAGRMRVMETVAAGTALAATTVTESDLRHGQPVAVVDAVGALTSTTYDEAGRVIRIEDAAGRSETRQYRTSQQHGTNATVVEVPGGVVTTTITDVLGRIVRVMDNIDRGVVRTGHERLVESREYPEPGVVVVTDAWGAVTRSERDGLGRPLRTVAPSGLAEVHTYDDVTQRHTRGLTPSGDLADAEVTATVTEDEVERVTETVGARRDGRPVPPSVRTRDGLGLETSVTEQGVTTRNEYDRLGNAVASITVPEVGAATGTPGGPMIVARAFDGFGQSVRKTLTDATGSRSAGSRELDPLGRTIVETDPAGRSTSYAYTPDGLVAEQTSTDGQRVSITYDQLSRLPVEQVTTSPSAGPVRTRFTYDPVTRAVQSVFDPTDADGTVVRYESDAWGNTTAVRYPDGSVVGYGYDEHGRRTARYDYDEYGARLSPVREPGASVAMLVGDVTYQPFGYAGEYTNPSGTQHLQVRTYDAETRRFQQLDLAAQHNAYWFGNANPVRYVDPSGRQGQLDVTALIMAGLGLGFALAGFWGALSAATVAMANVGSWAAVLTGTKVALGFAIGAAVTDVGLSTALMYDQFGTKIFDEDVAVGLGAVTLALGLASAGLDLARTLAPVRSWDAALQKNWSPERLAGWREAYHDDGTPRQLMFWVADDGDLFLGQSGLSMLEPAPWSKVSTAVDAPKVMSSNGKALELIAGKTGSSQKDWTFAVLNPRFSVNGDERRYLKVMSPPGLKKHMEQHDIRVIRLHVDNNTQVMLLSPSERVRRTVDEASFGKHE